eukprot:TRINITY_DN231_c0_g1_i12.p1 TRINITY_DN231_c0_g1~~TRINITY_DN231_c0_g1_i12.p1  ORF type:complete len:362 (-),score=53.41 TRINITY_DN231_c0_g1_i12:183-1268(-)
MQQKHNNQVSLYVGNLAPQVTQALLLHIFSVVGEVTSAKIITDKTGESLGYGFVDFRNHHSAERALNSLNGRNIYGSEIKVNWAAVTTGKEDVSNHHHLFVGDIGPEVTDETLWEAFKMFDSLSDARVLKDPMHNRSRGYGFVAFRDRADAEHAIHTMNGVWLGTRAIRVNWASQKTTKAAANLEFDTVAAQTPPSSTTVYVGNIAPETTEGEVRSVFSKFGKIEEIRMQCDKGYAFVRYPDHHTATRAIIDGNGEFIGVRSVRCSWGKERAAEPVPPVVQGIPPIIPPVSSPAITSPAIPSGVPGIMPYPMYPAVPYMMYGAGMPPYSVPTVSSHMSPNVSSTMYPPPTGYGNQGQTYGY